MTAILFGSIGTIADTSEMQRYAFNTAFSEHGLSWDWDRNQYREMLRGNGGAQRIAEYATSRGEVVDAAAIHRTKSEVFQNILSSAQLEPRPGVVETIGAAKANGLKVALVTTTSPDNIAALAQALSGSFAFSDFDLVVDSSLVSTSKPDPASYQFALEQLNEQADDGVAIEDNVGGVQSARAAGLHCLAFPNSNTTDHDFSAADQIVDHIELQVARNLLVGAAS